MQESDEATHWSVPWIGAVLVALALVGAACGDTNVVSVEPGDYVSLVPTADQLASPAASGFPDAYRALRTAGINEIVVTVTADRVSIVTDESRADREVSARSLEVAAEADDVFQSTFEAEILHLGADPLSVGPVSIARPVIAPRDLRGRPVITLAPVDADGDEYDVTCASTDCLVLASTPAPSGDYGYVGGDEPEDSGPVSSVSASNSSATLVTGSGGSVDAEADGTTMACGISENPVWIGPSETGLPIEDAVLIDTTCPWSDGRTMTILPRASIPMLIPWGESAWCRPGPKCLVFSADV